MRTRSLRSRSRLWHAPAFLLLYQVAPVQAHLDEIGRIRIALGFSRGRYEDQQLECGSVVGRAPVSRSVIGGQAELWASRSLRFSADGGVQRVSSDSAWADVGNGAFGSLLLGYEGKHAGIGGGVTTWPARSDDPSHHVLPSLYLRLGRADKLHFRLDDNASSAPGSPPGYRLGLASGYAERWQPRWFAGMLLGPGSVEIGGIFGDGHFWPGFGGELSFPVGKRLQPLVQGQVRFTHGQADWNLGLGLRAGLGKPR